MSLRFVLMRPRNPENIGAVARALKNFGFSDWAIVDPPSENWSPARKLAVQSEDVLEGVRFAPSLDEAIRGCVWVIGTTSRSRRGRRRLPIREAAPVITERSVSGSVAIVFGDERSGLTNEELDRCDAVSTVLTSPSQPSINLAQAVLLYAYELRLALEGANPRRGSGPAPATVEERRRVESALGEMLRAGRFLRDTRGEALRTFVSTLERATLSKREAALWEAALRAVVKRLS